ncbi:unnamed protein product [Callosobruchus maculatus]|uniref:DDE Tnp4 domain-containing protein n=1 Tax=Callosobruchus maculatus TaxID=64391 RepID=A0A653BXP2_CALMS|nr:unnamed protein product [Callosobruchus maculatus]
MEPLIYVASQDFFEVDDIISYWNWFKDSNYTKLRLLLVLFLQEHSMTPKSLYPETWMINYNNIQFFQLFRMDKGTLEVLASVLAHNDIEKILQRKYTGGHYPLSLTHQLLIFLWYMGTQDTLLSIENHFNVSRTTVMNIVRLLYFTLRLKKMYIKFPKTERDFEYVAESFKKYPGVAGAIDGTHIFVTVKKEQQDSYTARYRRHSINLMVICDASKMLTYAFVGFPGSAHDSRVSRYSRTHYYIKKLNSMGLIVFFLMIRNITLLETLHFH